MGGGAQGRYALGAFPGLLPFEVRTVLKHHARGETAIVRSLRIFIASPGDVNPERLRAALIIEKLAKDYARFFEIGFVRWELEPMLASGNFQDHLVAPGETDIFVMILWSRLGSPLPERTPKREYRGIDGRVPVTGTEWEFENALSAQRAKGVPDLLAYRKQAPPAATYRSQEDLAELGRQWEMLGAFWQRYFVEFRAAFREFQTLDDFEVQLENDLRRLIERRIAAETGAAPQTSAATWLKGSPFRGLDAYAFEHAPIFFGRTKETKDAIEQLVATADAGCAFLLILGASGAGKSSLVQAGIVPSLSARGFVNGVGAWRRAVVRPAAHPGGPFAALAQALTAEPALPELLTAEQDAEALARHLAGSAQEPAYPIAAALSAREQAGRRRGELLEFEQVRLALVVDQLEELFTIGDVTPEQRRNFILCLDGLARSGRVTVIATMRSDYWHRATEVPLLVELAAGKGRLDLLPASQAEIAEMIRRPAEAAGLTLETHPRTEIRLDAVLAEHAESQPGALPLLSFLLDALYARDVTERGGKALTYASMETLGGLTGAIKERAETAFGALEPRVQAALPDVLRALVTVSRSGAEPTARAAPMSRFGTGTPERRLVDALLAPEMRLLVAEGDGEGARIRVAHEALLTHWDRAKAEIARDRDDLRTRATVEEAQAEWQAASGKNRRALLLRDPRLGSALDLASRWRESLSAELLDFITLSDKAARATQRRRWIIAVSVMTVLLMLAAVSAIGLYIAETQRNDALIAQSQFLARDSRMTVERGDAVLGMQLALEALPASMANPDRPFVADAEYALENAVANQRERAVLRGHVAAVVSVAFSPDGTRIVTASDDSTARLWDVGTRTEIVVLRGHTDLVSSAHFSPDGTRVVTASRDHTARIWNATTGALLVVLLGHKGSINSAVFSADGSRIVTASADNTARLWDAKTGTEIAALHGPEADLPDYLGGRGGTLWYATFSPNDDRVITTSAVETAQLWNAKTGAEIVELGASFFSSSSRGISGTPWSAAFSPDGTRLVTPSTSGFDSTARVWNTDTGTEIAVLRGHEDEVTSAAFSPDGTQIVTTSRDHTARIWDAKTGGEFAVLRGHEGAVRSAAFSLDGTHVVTVSDDMTARLWNAKTGTAVAKSLGHGLEIAVLRGHEGAVRSAAFSPDGTRVVTASDDATTRLWDVKSAAELIALHGHDRLESAVFSPDGTRIITASFDDVTARIWDTSTAAELLVLRGHEDGVRFAGFSPDGARIITASEDKTARLWDAKTGAELAVLRGHESDVVSGAFSPNGAQVVTASFDHTARVWDAATGAELLVLKGHDDGLWSARFSPDGTRIVTASADNTARLWDATTGATITVLRGHGGNVKSAAFSPDGTRVVTASYDKTARIWDAHTGATLEELPSRGDWVFSASFSPDGKRIVTASADQIARLWSSKTGVEIAKLSGHEDAIKFAEFSPDGALVVTASDDRSARLWSIGTRCQALADLARSSLPRFLSNTDRKREFLENSLQSPLMRLYLRLRPALSFALPAAGERCE